MNGDILDRVRAADPLAGRPLPDATDATAVEMRERIIAGEADVVDLDARRRRRRRAIIGVPPWPPLRPWPSRPVAPRR